ncbi:uncharacterized protein LOC142576550 [Dermacentor variabilis]|uniref:uncharacterized protein LOC142576550 n=1 Tax=Dermacentor variabilis TaxID=34621 RepID=UPI003F5C8192
MPVVVGQIGDHVVLGLRDSGANTPLVRRSLVKDEELTGQTSTLTLADCTVGYLPEARILVSTPYYTGKVVAKCVEQPIYDLIVGNITGARSVEDPDPEWSMLDVEEKRKEEKSTTTQASDGAVTFSSAVETRAQATGRAMQRLERKKQAKEKSKDKKHPSKDKSKDKKNKSKDKSKDKKSKSKDKKSKGKDSKENKKKKGFYTWLSSKSSKSCKSTKEKGGGKRKSKKAKKGSSKERSSRSRSKEKAGKAKSSKEKVGKGSKEKADKGSKEKDNKDMQSKEKQQSKEKHNKDKHANKGKHSKDKQSKESSKSSLSLQEYAFQVEYIEGRDNVGADFMSRAN